MADALGGRDGDPGRRGRGVRRRGPPELSDAAAADGPLAARDDPPPRQEVPVTYVAFDLLAPRRRSRCSPSRTSAAASCSPGSTLDGRLAGARPRTTSATARRSSTRPGPRASRGSSASGSAAPTGRAPAARLAQDPRAPRPGAGDRRLHARRGRAHGLGRLAPRRLLGRDARGGRVASAGRQRLVYAGGVGTGFTDAMLKRLIGAARAARHRRDAPFELGEDPREKYKGRARERGAGPGLGRAAAGRRVRVHRVDPRGHPPPAVVQGPPRRQGPARGRARG